MKKTLLHFSLAATMLTSPLAVLAQSLPDEINHPPFHRVWQEKSQRRDVTQRSLSDAKSNLQTILSQISSENAAISRYNQLITNLRSERNNLEYELPQVTRERNIKSADVSSLSTSLNYTTTNMNNLSSELERENTRLQEVVNDLNQVRTRLERFMQSENSNQRELSNLQSQRLQNQSKLDSATSEKHSAQTRIADLRRVSPQTPDVTMQIQRQENIIARAETNIREANKEIIRLDRQIQSTNTELAQLQDKIKDLRQRERRLGRDYNDQNSKVDDLNRRYSSLEREYNETLNNLNSAQAQLARLEQRLSEIRTRIPNIAQEINYNQSEIHNAERQISNLQISERNTRSDIARLESELSQRQSEVNTAYAEYTKRYNLYIKYKMDAEQLGIDQTTPAVNLGRDKGEEIAENLSKRNSDEQSKIMGEFLANMISMVRAENEFYPNSYSQGFNDAQNRQTAKNDGDRSGRQSAHNFAQLNLKPQFFEKHLTDIITGRLTPMRELVLPVERDQLLQNFAFTTFINESANVPRLTAEEIQKSQELYPTGLDSKIAKSLEDKITLLAQVERMRNADFAYEAPSSIPFQTHSCSNVYKNVRDFIESCERAYREAFTQTYLDESYTKFADLYPNLYQERYSEKENIVLTRHYPEEFTKAQAIVKHDADKNGKADAYDQVFKLTHDESYEDEMPNATQVADSNAKDEAIHWTTTNPVVSVKSHGFASDYVRGSMRGALRVTLKNLGSQDSLSTGELQIMQAQNLVFDQNATRLVNVPKKGEAVIEVPFSVNRNAKSGEIAKAKVKFLLPRDKYQVQRIETKDFEIRLSANPSANMELSFDRTPRIRKRRTVYIHLLNIEVAPSIESLSDGYKIVLSAANSSQEHVEFKETEFTTSALSKDQKAEGTLRYLFNNSAEGKEITLYADVFYKGEKVQRQEIKLYPH